MSLEELLYSRMSSYTPMTDHLSKYRGVPSVFYQKAPDDTDSGWTGKQYPRVVTSLNLQANTERKSAGTFVASVYCDTTGEDPETISPEIVESLKDVILNDGKTSYAFAWSRTDPFELLGETDRRVIGQDVRFDVLEMPVQEITDPDPVEAMETMMAGFLPNAKVIGKSDLNQIVIASAESPVIYVGFETASIDYETFAFTWIRTKVSIHVICPDLFVRLKTCMAIAQELSEHDEIMMSDGSSMRAESVSVDNRTDYLQTGQISVILRYGIINHRNAPNRMMHAYLSAEFKERKE